jgi:exopolysaccharide/PEP-CTERM locus tyrosine autokinase
VGKISNALDKYRQERKLERKAAAQQPEMRPEDWDVLMRYNKKTGILNLHNHKIIKDSGTIHRLLANSLISSDGRLSSAARRKCEERRKLMREALAGEKRRDRIQEESIADVAEKQKDSQIDTAIFEEETQEIGATLQAKELNETDLTILMGYDRSTGRLLTNENETGEPDPQSSETMSDRGVLQRLLNAKMIYPGGKLTPAGIALCAELIRQHQNETKNEAAPVERTADIDQIDHPEMPAAELEGSDWAALMEYDRDTGNLLKYDPETGKLDDRSKAVLRDPEAIQRLIDNKMILPGGWLTRDAKQVCERRAHDFQEAVEKQETTEIEKSRLENNIIAPAASEIHESDPANIPEAPKYIEPEPARPPEEDPKIPAPQEDALENRVITEVEPAPENKVVKRSRRIFESKAIDNNLVTLLDPLSHEAEQFKMLRTNLFYPVSGKVPRSILVTSTVPGEGKSFVASNLAIAISQDIDRYVLVVDCDLRRPKIHTQFGFGDVPGLSDYLAKGTDLQDLLINTRVSKLSILPAGKTPPNPAELLSSEKMSALLEEITQRYRDRMIIIDSPPPKLTAESSFLARKVDGVVLVVNYGKTRRDDVKELVGKLGKDKIIGSVINRFDRRSMGYYGYMKDRKYGHYYNIKS